MTSDFGTGYRHPLDEELLGHWAVLKSRHVIPLFINVPRPILVGTGFFIGTPRNLYLVTAAHVFQEAAARGKQQARGADQRLFIHTGQSSRVFLTGPIASRIGGGLDVAVMRCEHSLDWRRTDIRPWPFGAVDRAAYDPSSEFYSLIGYPLTKFRFRIESPQRGIYVTPYRLATISAPVATYQAQHTDPCDQILLDFDKRNTFVAGPVLKEFPKPVGMSGAPLWSIASRPDGIYIALRGVAIEHLQTSRCIVCTRIAHVAELIDQCEAASHFDRLAASACHARQPS